MLEQTIQNVEQGAKIADWVNKKGTDTYSLSNKGDTVSAESALKAYFDGDKVYENGEEVK